MVDFRFDTDKQYQWITGLFVGTTDRLGLNNSLLEASHNGQEFLNHEVKLLQCDPDMVPPDEHFLSLEGFDAGGSHVSGQYTDGNNAGHTAYTITLYLRLEKDAQ